MWTIASLIISPTMNSWLSADLIPPWVHKFWQWHVDMFKSLDEDCKEEVYQVGAWVTISPHKFSWLDPGFQVPMEPIWIQVPSEHHNWLAKFCSTLRNPTPNTVSTRETTPEDLTMPQRCTKQLQTMSKFFSLTLFLIFLLSNFSLIAFDSIPNKGLGCTTHHSNRKHTHADLLTMHQDCHWNASPETQSWPLPHLISVKVLEQLRHGVPLVSLFIYLVLSYFIDFSFL